MNRIGSSGNGKWAALLLVLGLAGQCMGTVYNLQSGGSIANFDDATGNLYSWSVDTQNQLNVQNFWYRLGAGTDLQLSSPVVNQSAANQLTASYNLGQVSVGVTYILTGTALGNGKADLDETISIQNISGSPLSFNLFQYSDFDLAGSMSGDTAYLNKDFLSGKITSVVQYKGLVNFTIASTAMTPSADVGEVNFALSPNGLSVANTAQDLTLATGPTSGPDVNWALEWKFPGMAANQEDLIGLHNSITGVSVPEPSICTLFLAGLACWSFFGRRVS
jgi:hypothetical protein